MILLMKKRKPIQMKTKQEICVPIRDEKELQQAKDMLERNGEDIWDKGFDLSRINFYNYLFCDKDNDWWLSYKEEYLTEIPLSELESVLRGESESKKQSSIEWNSVKEVGMPKHSNTVLVVNNDYEDTLITLGIGINETEFYIIELKENSSNVTHWMELPEKPNKND